VTIHCEKSKREGSFKPDGPAGIDRPEGDDCVSLECFRFLLSLPPSSENFRFLSFCSGDSGGRSLSLIILGGRPKAGFVGSRRCA
jgi:hypothetical protein